MSERGHHLERINVLRAVAILSVYFCHALPEITGEHKYEALGWGGVALFFVLSGFCIHHSYLHQRDKNPDLPLLAFTGQFWWRRFWRIYPPYLAALIFFWFLNGRTNPLPPWHFWSHLFLIHNLQEASFSSVSAVFWSLAVEWQFYLLYPGFLWLYHRLGVRNSLGAVGLASLALRFGAAVGQDFHEPIRLVVWHSPFILFFDWCLGVWLAEQWHRRQSSPRLEWAAGPVLILFVGSCQMVYTRPFAFTLAALGFAGVMSYYLRRDTPLHWLEKILVPAGICSYSFYLFHHPLIGRLGYWFHRLGLPDTMAWNTMLFAGIVLMLLLVLSWISFNVLEKSGIKCGQWLWSKWWGRSETPVHQAGSETKTKK